MSSPPPLQLSSSCAPQPQRVRTRSHSPCAAVLRMPSIYAALSHPTAPSMRLSGAGEWPCGLRFSGHDVGAIIVDSNDGTHDTSGTCDVLSSARSSAPGASVRIYDARCVRSSRADRRLCPAHPRPSWRRSWRPARTGWSTLRASLACAPPWHRCALVGRGSHIQYIVSDHAMLPRPIVYMPRCHNDSTSEMLLIEMSCPAGGVQLDAAEHRARAHAPVQQPRAVLRRPARAPRGAGARAGVGGARLRQHQLSVRLDPGGRHLTAQRVVGGATHNACRAHDQISRRSKRLGCMFAVEEPGQGVSPQCIGGST